MLFFIIFSLLTWAVHQGTSSFATDTAVFRASFNLPELPFSAQLRQKNSTEFQENAQRVMDAIDYLLLEQEPSYRNSSVLSFRFQQVIGTIVLVDMEFARLANVSKTVVFERVKKRFEEGLEEGHIGWLTVTADGFEFVEVQGGGRPTVSCPDGSMPEYSLHGGTYCWSHSVCPTGSGCIEGQCCKTAQLEWECTNQCISMSQRCDGVVDCGFEVNDTTVEMPSDELFCNSGICLS